MSEWLKAHAWKLNLDARADAYQIPPTQFRFNEFRNINVRRRVPVNDGVAPGFRGVCDRVLTQFADSLTPYISMFLVRIDGSGPATRFSEHSTEIPKSAEGRSFQDVRRPARVGRASHQGKSARSETSRPFERLEDTRG